MANDTRWSTHPDKMSSISLEDALNSLANNGMVVSGDIDNTACGYTDGDIQLVLAEPEKARTASPTVILTFLKSGDGGITFSDGSATVTPSSTNTTLTLSVAADATAQRLVVHTALPNGHFKLHVTNKTGRDFAATGNSVTLAGYCLQFQDPCPITG